MDQIEKITPTSVTSAIPQGVGAKRTVAETAVGSAHENIEHLAEVARPAVSRAASSAHRLVDRVAGSTNRVAQQLQETGTRLKDAEQRLVGASSLYVREHPLRSMGIALAAGFLVSRLASSRKSTSSAGKPPEGGLPA